MDDDLHRCASCAGPLPVDTYELTDLGGDVRLCAGCFRLLELDAELEDALFGV